MFKVNFQKRFLQFAVAVTLCLAGAAQSKPKNVIFFIGDGMGPQQVKAGGIYAYGAAGTLSFELFPYQGELTTYQYGGGIPDSAAAATSLATGYKVNGGVVSMAYPGYPPDYPEGSELLTLLEYSKALGKSTGLVSTAYLTDATSAAFGAHEPTRSNYSQIAGDYLNQTQPNVLFGGGANGMSRSSAEAAGYTVVENKAAMLALDTENVSKVSGQFGSADLPYEYDGLGSLPHLSEMTTTALSILDNDTDGFFLMVEGGRIDDACHSNDFTRTIPEVNEFADAVQAAIDWAAGRNDTLIIVAADHETGGLTVLSNNGAGNYPDISWSGTGHTATNVPVYAWGVNAGFISGVMDNTDIFGIVTADTVTLDSPSDGSVLRDTQVSFTCSATSDYNLIDATLYLGQASGTSNTVTFSGPAETDDAQISADSPNTNYGAVTPINVDGATPHAHAVIKFPNIFGSGAGQVPSGAVITSATLKVNCTNAGNLTKLYRLIEDWVESQVTWNNRSSGTPWTGAGAQGGSNAGVAINGDCTALGWRTIDITQFVQEWSNGASNYGLVLMDSGSDGIDFDSSESANLPLLTVTYQSMQPIGTKTLSGTSGSVTFGPFTLTDQTDYVWNCLVRSTNGPKTWQTWAPADSHFRVDSQLPDEPVLISPVDGATNISTSPTLDVTVSDPQGGLVDVTFYSRTVPSPDDYFTIVVLPDTQYYTQSNTFAIFDAQTQWIVNNVATNNIVFVTHEGDIVDVWNNTTQWQNANNNMSLLDGVVPYGVLPGNHDKNNGDIYLNDRTYFNQNFPYTRYAGLNWYGGHFPSTGNENNFQLFSAGGDDYVFIHLEDYPDDGTPGAVIAWAGSVLASYPNRKAIITTHGYLNTTGGYTGKWGSTQYIRDNLVAAYDNVYFVFSGHHTGEYTKTTSVNGRQVHELLADYHADGWLRIMRFVPAENKVYVKTYSPWLGQYQTDTNSRFTLNFPMNEFKVIGQVSGVSSGQNASIVWSSLATETLYEWYVTVTDSTERIRTGPAWSFTTGLGNQPPAALDDAYDVNEDNTLTVDAVSGVLANDSDVDSNSLTAVLVGDVGHGTLTLNSDGSFTYTPNSNFNGSDSFTYKANDGASNSSPATVTITVNNMDDDPPVAVEDMVTTDEDTQITIDVLGNDNDPEGATLSVAAFTQPANGTVSNNSTSVTYTPNANCNGSDSFTYTATDGNFPSNEVAVTVTVTAVNDSPAANDDTASTNEDTAATVNVLANDSDVDNDTLIVESVTQGSMGSVVKNEDNTVTYTPNANLNGTDTFTYTSSDGRGGTDSATVTITVNPVNDPPVANAGPDQTVTDSDNSGSENVTLDGSASSDPEDSIVSYEWKEGENVIGNTATITPDLAVGVHAITLTVTDNGGATGTDDMTVTVNANQAPTANAGTDQTVTDNDYNGGESVTLSGSGTDTDGTITAYEWKEGANFLGDTATITPDLALGVHTITLTVTDNGGAMGSDEVTVTVEEGPTAIDDTANSDITVSGTITSGSYASTASSDNVYEAIREIRQGSTSSGRSVLEHKWTINVTGGSDVSFHVEAHHTANSEADDFVFAYSTNNVTYTNLLTVTKTADDNTVQSAALPSSLSGTVYVRVQDTDRTKGRTSLDTIYVDQMFIRSQGFGPDTSPPSPNPMTWAVAPYAASSTSVSMTATTASDVSGVEYYFTCTAGGGNDSGWQNSPTYEDTGLTPETSYTYTVNARDKSANQNETAVSTAESATTQPGGAAEVYVNDIAMGSGISGKNYYAQATVWIRNNSGANVAAATVYGNWSGAVTGSANGITGTDGKVTLRSPNARNGGTFTFTVTNVVISGYTYNPGLNLETSDSIINP